MCLGRPQKMAVVFSCRSSHTQLVVKEEAGVVSWRENKRARSGVGEKREWGKERRGYATLSDDVTLPAPSVARPCGPGVGFTPRFCRALVATRRDRKFVLYIFFSRPPSMYPQQLLYTFRDPVSLRETRNDTPSISVIVPGLSLVPSFQSTKT